MNQFVAGRGLRRADLALSTEWKQPKTETEAKLAAIWQDVLGIDVVGTSDDFFELDGDSLAATALAAEIEASFGTRFSPADIINFSTVAQQARAMAAASCAARELPSCLVLGPAGGAGLPAFVVHGLFGFAFFRPNFLDVIAEDRPIYLFQAPGLDGSMTPLESVEEIAALYVKAMRTIQPIGPYHIVAMCAGSFIALEMCSQIEEAGQAVARLVLLDPPPVIPAMKHRQRAKRQTAARRLLHFFTRWGYSKEVERGQVPRAVRKHIRARAERRLELMNHELPGKRSYTAESMSQASTQLRAALYKYVPRPYLGRAALLVNSKNAQEIFEDGAFWPKHLGSIQYEVLGSGHDDIFDAQLAETGRFVREALN